MAVYKSDVCKWGNILIDGIAKDLAEMFLKEAYKAATYSPDTSNQCGAVLVSPTCGVPNVRIGGLEVVARGYNHFSYKLVQRKGMKFLLQDKTTKYAYIDHAERDVIYDLIRNHWGISPSKCIMYCPWVACDECAREIAGVGIPTVIGHKQRMDMTPDRWHNSVKQGLDILVTNGVNVQFFDGLIYGCPDIIVNGEEWNPGIKSNV